MHVPFASFYAEQVTVPPVPPQNPTMIRFPWCPRGTISALRSRPLTNIILVYGGNEIIPLYLPYFLLSRTLQFNYPVGFIILDDINRRPKVVVIFPCF